MLQVRELVARACPQATPAGNIETKVKWAITHALGKPPSEAVVVPQSSPSRTVAQSPSTHPPLNLPPLLPTAACYAAEDSADTEQEEQPTVADDIGASREASRTDAEAVERCLCLLTRPLSSTPPSSISTSPCDVSDCCLWHHSRSHSVLSSLLFSPLLLSFPFPLSPFMRTSFHTHFELPVREFVAVHF